MSLQSWPAELLLNTYGDSIDKGYGRGENKASDANRMDTGGMNPHRKTFDAAAVRHHAVSAGSAFYSFTMLFSEPNST